MLHCFTTLGSSAVRQQRGGHALLSAQYLFPARAGERAAQRVLGIKGLAVKLDVRLGTAAKRTDADIAIAAESALRWNALVPEERQAPMTEHMKLMHEGIAMMEKHIEMMNSMMQMMIDPMRPLPAKR